MTHSRTDDYPIGRVLRDQAQFPSNRFFVEAKTEPKFIFLFREMTQNPRHKFYPEGKNSTPARGTWGRGEPHRALE